jgi:methylthioribose-1-phosphate isomerase
MSRLKTIAWTGSAARCIDQTLLPGQLEYVDITTIKDMFHAIKTLKIRGAPAIGIAAAYGLYLGCADFPDDRNSGDFLAYVEKNARYLAGARPTAVNLFWALDRCGKKVHSAGSRTVSEMKQVLLDEANTILEEDRAMGRKIGEFGYELLHSCKSILTHCNAGGLATAEWGTALAPVYIAAERGTAIHVFADETRPLLQGSRITAFELHAAGIPVTLLCDNMAAFVMAQRKIDAVFVGADRIAGNGDFANKIGTYGVALLAKAHSIPFYVAAPFSSFDLSIKSGEQIPIEERGEEEVTNGFGKRTAPEGVAVYNPAFDVTPGSLVTAFVTEKGIVRPPFTYSIAAAAKN